MQSNIWKLKVVFLPVNLPSESHMALPGTKTEDKDKREQGLGHLLQEAAFGPKTKVHRGILIP